MDPRPGILHQKVRSGNAVAKPGGPPKTKVAHGLAASLSYGLAPAKSRRRNIEGDHAPHQIRERSARSSASATSWGFPARPRWNCPHATRRKTRARTRRRQDDRSTPSSAAARWLTPTRAISSSSMVLPHPDPQGFWLVRPQSPLAPGEYALMARQPRNMNIYPFHNRADVTQARHIVLVAAGLVTAHAVIVDNMPPGANPAPYSQIRFQEPKGENVSPKSPPTTQKANCTGKWCCSGEGVGRLGCPTGCPTHGGRSFVSCRLGGISNYPGRDNDLSAHSGCYFCSCLEFKPGAQP